MHVSCSTRVLAVLSQSVSSPTCIASFFTALVSARSLSVFLCLCLSVYLSVSLLSLLFSLLERDFIDFYFFSVTFAVEVYLIPLALDFFFFGKHF